ncbi:hypothetical protein [Terriglobus tenax]|uniref:hypothetical protein n=1 Tax=Terriglobus tenax TaxID=1111115 RepID=UPI0021E0F61F|nr:hypothetical protein [Terriglobus tenax]
MQLKKLLLAFYSVSVLFTFALIGCADSSPTPTITSLSPASANAGSSAFTLTVTGTGFSSGAAVQWNGSSRSTTVVSATQLTASIPAADVASAGTAQVTVLSKGRTSTASSFTINAPVNPNPAPTVSSLSPATTVAGGAAFNLTVNGSNFVSGATVQWDGAARPTSFVSSTQLTANLTAADIASAGSKAVTVVNPSPGGGASNAVAFTITSPPPTLSSLLPATATAGGAAFTLTVNGSGFLTGAAVAWNGSTRPTTVVSVTQLTSSITAADIATAGTAQVDVVQGSLRSTNQLSFTINAAPPTLTSISPSTTGAGSAGFDLTVNGTGFTNSAQVAWNGTPLTTTFVSATQLKAAVPAVNVASTGSVKVDVVQGGIHTSSQQTFTVTAARPVISSISPTSVLVNAAAFTMTVNGTGFTSNSVLQWGGSALVTHVQSSAVLTADIPAADLTTAGTFQITVSNPAADGGTSQPVNFTVAQPVTGKIVQLVSTSYLSGGVANNSSYGQTVSQDGRYVGFASAATDIVANDIDGNNSGFLRDTCVGPTAPAGCTPGTIMVSQPGAFTTGSGVGPLVMVSNSGRYVGFDTAGQDKIDVYDSCLGATTSCTSGITQVQEPFPGVSGSYRYNNGSSSRMSPDGRYLFYTVLYTETDNTGATALVVKDTCFGASAGCTPTVRRVATGKGITPPKQSFQSDVSEGGRYVLFRAYLTAVDPALTSDGTVLHIWLEDTCIGAPAGCTESYTLIDIRADGTPSEGNQANDSIADEEPSFSRDGRYVVFSTTDKNMIAGRTINNGSQVYLRDTCIGAPAGCTSSTILISEWPDMATAASRAYVGWRSVSEHGRYVAFMHQGDQVGNFYAPNIFVRDTCNGAPAGCTPSTSMASSDPDGINPATNKDYRNPSISSDGHYVVVRTPEGVVNGGHIFLALTGY